MARRPRRLTPEERALWNEVAKRTERMHPVRSETVDASKQTLFPPKKVETRAALPTFGIGDKARPRVLGHDLAPSIGQSLAGAPVSMDRKQWGKMRKGKLVPEARIDLHGMTIAQAHPALMRFVLDAVAQERRLILVITGKGKIKDEGGPIPERHGVLRHQVPHWLNSAPLRAHVLQISEAHIRHGGHGAFYVYLRRPR